MKNKIIQEDMETITNEPLEWSKLEGKSILISGANGFLATYIVLIILYLNEKQFKKKATVLALVRNIEKAKDKFKDYIKRDDLKFITQDISDPFDINEPIDFIIHSASQASSLHFGRDPVGTLKANTLGTAHLLDIAKKNDIEKFLFFSSGEVYGMIDDSIESADEAYTGNVDFLDVRSCYGESKRMGENMCICWNYQHKVPVNVIRVGYTYGPGLPLNDDRIMAEFVNRVLNNENIVLNSDGSAKRSFCYITDMIKAVFLILLNGKDGEVYNAASEVPTSILELAEMLIGLFPEKGLSVEYKKNEFEKNYLRSKREKTLVSTKKIKALGWNRVVDIKTGFKRMIDSYM